MYATGRKFVWWGVSSCTSNLEVLKSDQFLGNHGIRTLFSIECLNGKPIGSHSYFENQEEEVILMPGFYFKVMGQLNLPDGLHIIHLKEIQSPITLVKPPFENLLPTSKFMENDDHDASVKIKSQTTQHYSSMKKDSASIPRNIKPIQIKSPTDKKYSPLHNSDSGPPATDKLPTGKWWLF
ncbi:unnamed protein product [Rotaria sp. Silwood1]|nr:unnamed protein product [Rotaria sp. Silwood1]CAF3463462.1 unnamed protein product [Rotaria sp. Silwood1]CAF4887362.1 unnamed protein product [Rotaria sp. Silwood1]